MNNKAPCYNCSKRYEACHSSCVSYKEWRSMLDNENSVIRKVKTEYNNYRSQVCALHNDIINSRNVHITRRR